MEKVRFHVTVVVAVLALAVLSISQEMSFEAAMDKGREDVKNRLAELSPDAIPLYEQAATAEETQMYDRAILKYTELLEKVPQFHDAIRRLGWCHLLNDDKQKARLYFQKALEKERSAANLYAMASFITSTRSKMEWHESIPLLKEGMLKNPSDPWILFKSVEMGFEFENPSLFSPAIDNLIKYYPSEPQTYVYSFFEALINGDIEGAGVELENAKNAGLEDSDYTNLEKVYNDASSNFLTTLKPIGIAAGIWIIGLLFLLGIGFVLSKKTLQTIDKCEKSAEDAATPTEKKLRKIYKFIISLTSVYYYISLPFVILLVIGLAAIVGYGFLALGRIPIKLAIFILFGVLYTLYAMIKSLFVRLDKEDPGRVLEENEAPALWTLLKDIANRLETRPVDRIFITPGSELAVMERGSLRKKLQGNAERCLILGAGILKGMKVNSFSAILAHEYGHFVHKDTAGGSLAIQVQKAIHDSAVGLTMNALDRWYNPAWLFINGFYLIFLRVTQGASRLQEILADRYAALNFGSISFIEGLEHVIRRSVEFDMTVSREIDKALKEKSEIKNIYNLSIDMEEIEEFDTKVQESLERTESAYDSHPATNRRIELVKALNIEVNSNDKRDAWELLPNQSALEDEMTQQIGKNVKARIEYEKEWEKSD